MLDNALIAQGVTLPAEITYDFAGNLQGTIQAIYAYMEKMPEYVTATFNVPGWSFNLLLTQVDLKTMYNGFFILPILGRSDAVPDDGAAAHPAHRQLAKRRPAGTGKLHEVLLPSSCSFAQLQCGLSVLGAGTSSPRCRT